MVWGDDELAEGLGELTQEVSEGAEEFVEGAQETAFGHQLVDGVDYLQEVVKGFDHPRVGAVGVLQFVSLVLLIVKAFVLKFPSESSSLI